MLVLICVIEHNAFSSFFLDRQLLAALFFVKYNFQRRFSLHPATGAVVQLVNFSISAIITSAVILRPQESAFLNHR
jgi:hypothetical protein